MNLTPDQEVYWQWGPFSFNLTIVFTWILMVFMVLGAKACSRKISPDISSTRWQSFLEIVVSFIKHQLEDIGLKPVDTYLSFLGTLFLFIATSNLSSIFPHHVSPTSSLSTTTALAISVFFSVIYFGIREQGVIKYLKTYLEPTPIMLPINIIGEFSRTLALAVRLFGNIMSGEMVVSILLVITPFFFPIVLNVFGFVIGLIQAYIFTILAAVYIAAGVQKKEE